ncbi:peptidoglycan DD-metalloendopeptidase family protein [Microbacterium sp. NPDC058389]|uniref:peptidoglycan DD-metalloendopeptidase family protein n=1 Tax=Microbacterium sp. NPDC058389 TaxID=3346475 RepID=UPI003656CE52
MTALVAWSGAAPPGLVVAAASASSPTAAAPASDSAAAAPRGSGWVWPARPFRLEQPFVAPPHAYGPGHRGIDLRPLDGHGLIAPAAGIVAFSGPVAGRGILTIDHGDGLVTTLEPIDSELVAGTPVERGELVGSVALGGHTVPGSVHLGVRLDGEYVNPLLLLGGVPRAVLLPCC